MKIATLYFSSEEARRRFADLLRKRLYGAGHQPHQVTDILRSAFQKPRSYVFSGTADADRVTDVALAIRGATCKITESP